MKLLRRFLAVRYTFLGVLLLIVLGGYLLLRSVPNVYESGASLAIERADEYVFGEESADWETLSQRAHRVISDVLRRENVLRNLREQGILEPGASEEERNRAVARFLGQAHIDFDNVSVINQYTGKLGLLSMGLVVSYRDEDPDLAHRLASALVEDVLRGGRSITDPASDQARTFLARELDDSSARLADVEGRIADFKNENALYLPELYPVVVRQLDELTAQIERSREDIGQARRDRASSAADLALTSPEALLFSTDGTRVESPGERLEQLRIERAFAASRYSANHPRLVSLERQIAALEGYANAGDTRTLEVELRQTEERLASLRERYSDEHPDVVAVRRELARLRDDLETASLEAAPRETSVPSNPAYNRLLARRDSIDEEIGRETRRLDQLERRHREVQEQLARMPSAERELSELERLLEREEQAYGELERQLTAVRLSSGMRGADLLERFVVVEPPLRPLEPVAPRRTLLFGLVLVLGLCAATVAALLRLRMRDAIWDREDLGEAAHDRVVLVPRFG